jgi:hypothetical protein
MEAQLSSPIVRIDMYTEGLIRCFCANKDILEVQGMNVVKFYKFIAEQYGFSDDLVINMIDNIGDCADVSA